MKKDTYIVQAEIRQNQISKSVLKGKEKKKKERDVSSVLKSKEKKQRNQRNKKKTPAYDCKVRAEKEC